VFLNYLKGSQKKLFLRMAENLIKADNKILPEEKELFDALRKELGCADFVFGQALDESQFEVFDTNETKNIVILELVALAYVDNEMAEEERDFILKIMKVFRTPSKKLKMFEKWVLKQKNLYEEAASLISKS